MKKNSLDDQKFRVGLSFSGAQRDYAELIALALLDRNIFVFYDGFHEADLWGCNLLDTLHDIYSEKLELVIVLISEDYAKKDYPNFERQTILAKAAKIRSNFLLPIRFDDTKLKGLIDSLCYLDAHKKTLDYIASLVCAKLGIAQRIKRSSVLPDRASSSAGEVKFSPWDNDGRYLIGRDEWLFEIKVSEAGPHSVYVYNDPTSIRGIGLAEGVSDISKVEDASTLNFTSRARILKQGCICILENMNGFFAALKLLDVAFDNINGTTKRICIKYVILTHGDRDFTLPETC